MVNKWIEHIKAFAKAHNISYGCALSNPKCLATYKSKKNNTIQSKLSNSEMMTLYKNKKSELSKKGIFLDYDYD